MAKRIRSEHRKAMDEIAAFLIEKETITGKEFMEILHRVEGTDSTASRQEGRIMERQEIIPPKDFGNFEETAPQEISAEENDPARDAQQSAQGQDQVKEESKEQGE